jgi:hypothetical protein
MGTLAQLKQTQVPIPTKLRGLWLLEKVARNKKLFSQEVKPKDFFQPLSEFFIFEESAEFVHRYQALKTVHAFMRQIKVKEEYPDSYTKIVEGLFNGITKLLPLCNADTVLIPVEAIVYLAKIDEAITRS